MYKLCKFDEYDYNALLNIGILSKTSMKDKRSYANAVIMADTETSKEFNNIICENYVVAFTISVGSMSDNVVTLYGNKPKQFIYTLTNLKEYIKSDVLIVYFHNLAYDWVFLRKFLMNEYGEPIKQLNVKPHYPISIEFENGIILKDSLILSQRSLDKWASDLQVEHQKAIGKWNYSKVRTQNESFTREELEYIEHDTLAGIECLRETIKLLGKSITSIPLTATGIPRDDVKKLSRKYHQKNLFNKIVPTFELYNILTKVYHGGYTHANRWIVDEVITGVKAYDFSSSYPYVMLKEKYPMDMFTPIEISVDDILKTLYDYAYIFKMSLHNVRLKNKWNPHPFIQFSKAEKLSERYTIDNGRIKSCDYIEIYTNEIDFKIFNDMYDYDYIIISESYTAYKDYLPRWFTDYIYSLFVDKTKLKGGDPVNYSIKKAKLNSIYGMCVQHSIKDEINENYDTGDFIKDITKDPLEMYETFKESPSSLLPYQWGCYVTSYATRNLFKLMGMCDEWLYSDTDSAYAKGWHDNEIKFYNIDCVESLRKRGYEPVTHNGREYSLGVAEIDGQYSEFKTLGSKRYCVRDKHTNNLKITVAGVPKKGVECLNNDINNFKKGFVFNGDITGKLQHTYFFKEEVEERNGIVYGDSIDLSSCDYLLDRVELDRFDIQDLEIVINGINMGVYDE